MQTSQGINTISATVYGPGTATENEARNSCDSCCTCACVNRAVCGRNGCIAVTLKIFLFILPICEMVLGALLYSEFERYSMIPTFLLVLGAVSLPLVVNVVFPKLICEPVRTVLMSINFLFLLGWFITGHFWTFQRFSFPYRDDGLSLAALSFIRINYVLILLVIVYICLYFCRRRYGVRNQQSGTYIDINKFYKQNMATGGFTQFMNPTTPGQQQMWIQVPTEDPRYWPSGPPMGPTV